MQYFIHPLGPLHSFGPCEVVDSILIAKLRLDNRVELEVLSSSYQPSLQALLADPKLGNDPKAWRAKLESLSLALVEVS